MFWGHLICWLVCASLGGSFTSHYGTGIGSAPAAAPAAHVGQNYSADLFDSPLDRKPVGHSQSQALNQVPGRSSLSQRATCESQAGAATA